MTRDLKPGVLVRRSPPAGLITYEEVAGRCGVHVSFVYRLVRLGVVDPDPDYPQYVQPDVTIRIQKLVRLQTDLGVNLEGAAIIVDLLDRIDQLEAELRAWHR